MPCPTFLLHYALRRESVGLRCVSLSSPLCSSPWPSTYPPTSYQAIEFPPCWDTGVVGMWIICQGNPTPTFHAFVCVSACKHVYALGLSPGISQTMSPVQAAPDKSVSVGAQAVLMLVAVCWKPGHPGHNNLSYPSGRCDMHATQHQATFVSPSPKHLYISSTNTVYNGDHTPLMILEAEPVDIYTTKSHHTHKIYKHSDKIAPSVAWTPCNTAICVQQHTPGISLLLFVLEWPSCWAFNCNPPPYFLFHYTIPNRAK